MIQIVITLRVVLIWTRIELQKFELLIALIALCVYYAFAGILPFTWFCWILIKQIRGIGDGVRDWKVEMHPQ